MSRGHTGKTNLGLQEQETVSGMALAGLYANLHIIPDNHASTPPLSRMPFLPPNQQCQSTESKDC